MINSMQERQDDREFAHHNIKIQNVYNFIPTLLIHLLDATTEPV
jgi:hypothetical protein